MIITCPHCQTRYQVAREAIGAVGRKVQCAHCMKAWQAGPQAEVEAPKAANRDDRMFNEMAEQQLDAAIEAEARAVALAEKVIADAQHHHVSDTPPVRAAAPPLSKADQLLQKRREKAFSQRQRSLTQSLPVARMRRLARTVAWLLLVGIVAGFFVFRAEIVRQFPDLAGVYEGIGLGVNVVGLDFREVKTLRSLRAGDDVLSVSATIFSVSGRAVPIPPVIVTLLDSEGQALYEWSVAPKVAEMEPGEVLDFETQLTGPPDNATDVKLSFAGGRTVARAAVEGF